MTPRLNKIAVFVGIFTIAFALRLVFVFQWDAMPYGAIPLLDADIYDKWAQQIAQGHILRERAFYMSPLYPYLLGALYAIFGHDLLIASLFNALLGAAAVTAVGITAFEAFGIESALVSGLLGAFYVPFVFYAAPAMKETLALFLTALFMLYALRAVRRNRLCDYAASGAMLGLDALVRSNIALLAPAILVAAFMKWRGTSKRNVTVFIAIMCLCIAPATLHNYLASSDFVPISYGGGLNLYFGHSSGSDATHMSQPFSYPGPEEYASTRIAAKALGHDPKPSEVSAYWRDRALDYMWRNPGHELAGLVAKTKSFWNGADRYDDYDIGFIRKNFNTVLAWPLAEFWVISCLAGFGAAVTWRAHRESVILLAVLIFVYMVSVVLFYVTDRYRLPVVIFLLPLAGAALPYGWKYAAEKSWRHLSVGAMLAMALAAVSALPFSITNDLTAFDWSTLSTMYGNMGDNDHATDALHKAVMASPKDPDAQSFLVRAFIAYRQGQQGEAENILQTAMRTYPADGILEYNYARLKESEGDMPAALEAMQKAVKLSPSVPGNYLGLAELYIRDGERTKALDAARHGFAIDPSDSQLRQTVEQLEKNDTTSSKTRLPVSKP